MVSTVQAFVGHVLVDKQVFTFFQANADDPNKIFVLGPLVLGLARDRVCALDRACGKWVLVMNTSEAEVLP